jgi:hypothetical protein
LGDGFIKKDRAMLITKAVTLLLALAILGIKQKFK